MLLKTLYDASYSVVQGVGARRVGDVRRVGRCRGPTRRKIPISTVVGWGQSVITFWGHSAPPPPSSNEHFRSDCIFLFKAAAHTSGVSNEAACAVPLELTAPEPCKRDSGPPQ